MSTSPFFLAGPAFFSAGAAGAGAGAAGAGAGAAGAGLVCASNGAAPSATTANTMAISMATSLVIGWPPREWVNDDSASILFISQDFNALPDVLESIRV